MDAVTYGDWGRCVNLKNEYAELIVTTEVGPRVIRFGFPDGENQFWEAPGGLREIGDKGIWINHGGHRLWHAPESRSRTYAPDNNLVRVVAERDSLRFIQPVETTTGIQKEIIVTLDKTRAKATVDHRLRNTNPWNVEMAPWAISVLAPGGTAVVPLPSRGPHAENLRARSTLSIWAYTDMSDPRWTWGERYLLIRQDTQMEAPQKIGASVPDGWSAYARQGTLFVKTSKYMENVVYPDRGASVEVFTDGNILELETLGSLVSVEPEGILTHRECWYLFSVPGVPESDQDVREWIQPIIDSLD